MESATAEQCATYAKAMFMATCMRANMSRESVVEKVPGRSIALEFVWLEARSMRYQWRMGVHECSGEWQR